MGYYKASKMSAASDHTRYERPASHTQHRLKIELPNDSVAENTDESAASSRSTTPTPTNTANPSTVNQSIPWATNVNASDTSSPGTIPRSDEEYQDTPSLLHYPTHSFLPQMDIFGTRRLWIGTYNHMGLPGQLDPMGTVPLGVFDPSELGYDANYGPAGDIHSPEWGEFLERLGFVDDAPSFSTMLRLLSSQTEEKDDGVSVRTSHPPQSKHGSASADLAYFMTSSTWYTPWFKFLSCEPQDRPGSINNQSLLTKSWSISGTKKHVYIGALFSDLSLCWGHVEFDPDRDYPKSEPISDGVEKDAGYIPPPEPMDQASLIQASETYGPIIAEFAKSLISSHKYITFTGDFASEALRYVESCESIPRPVPSVHGTYGHLIFEGRVYSKDDIRGRWRGGDSMVRRGDIVRWKGAKVDVLVKKPESSQSMLDLNHASIIMKDRAPKAKPKDGDLLSPKHLGKLYVSEKAERHYRGPQSVVYDMKSFQEGEMWIYRPVGMKAYLGVDSLRSKAPEEEEGVKTCGGDRKGKGVAR